MVNYLSDLMHWDDTFEINFNQLVVQCVYNVSLMKTI